MTCDDDLPMPFGPEGEEARPPSFLRRNGLLLALVVSVALNAGLGGYLLGRGGALDAARMAALRVMDNGAPGERIAEGALRQFVRTLPEEVRPQVVSRLAAARGDLKSLQRDARDRRAAIVAELQRPEVDKERLEAAKAAARAAGAAVQARLQDEIIAALLDAAPQDRIAAAKAIADRYGRPPGR